MTSFFARRSSLVLHYAWKGKQLLHRINGPVSWDALHEMRGLYVELGLKIQELERTEHHEHDEGAVHSSPRGNRERVSGARSVRR